MTSEVRLTVYNILGRKVAVLANCRYPAGRYRFTFERSSLASGVYSSRLEAGEIVEVRTTVPAR